MIRPIALTLFLVAIAGCGDAIDAADRATDCAQICDMYRDCASSNYDVEDCQDRCEDMVNDKDTARIDECENCLDEKSCVGSAFQCASECVGIVP